MACFFFKFLSIARLYPRPFFRIVLIGLLTGGLAHGEPPINDDCENAVEIGDGTFNGSNVDATTDGTATCGLFLQGTNDVWWRYVAPLNGTATIDTCGSEIIDTVLNVWSACDGVELACNDDQFLPGCELHSAVELEVSAGVSYWIRVAEFRGRVGGILLHIETTGAEGFCGDGTCDQDEDPTACPDDCATLMDFADLQVCFTADAGPTGAECERFDLDGSPHIGLDDFGEFVLNMLVGP